MTKAEARILYQIVNQEGDYLSIRTESDAERLAVQTMDHYDLITIDREYEGFYWVYRGYKSGYKKHSPYEKMYKK